jgi:hypothetical protein
MQRKSPYLIPTSALVEHVSEPLVSVSTKLNTYPKDLIPLAKWAHYCLGDLDVVSYFARIVSFRTYHKHQRIIIFNETIEIQFH